MLDPLFQLFDAPLQLIQARVFNAASRAAHEFQIDAPVFDTRSLRHLNDEAFVSLAHLLFAFV
jgi:hypothetical protein